MATHGIMKTEHIPFPSKKGDLTSTTEEICSLPAEEPQYPSPRNDANICYLPAPRFDCELKPLKMSKEFECEHPSVEPNVYRTRDPLSFPDNLHDLISWTDAFVDRIASMTQAEEKVRHQHLPSPFTANLFLEKLVPNPKIPLKDQPSRNQTRHQRS